MTLKMIMDASSELTPENKWYRQALETFIWQSYQLDRPKDDVTTKTFLGWSHPTVKATIFAKQAGILAGMQEARWFLDRLGLSIIHSEEDGERFEKGDIILQLQGRAHVLLAAERTTLNLLQRLSGIATLTKKMSLKLMPEIQLLATRKTLWGPLDKRAVALGGGGTHRLNLEDAILVKENHISLTQNFKKSLKAVFKKTAKLRFVEIELESEAQVNEFLELHQDLKKYTDGQENLIVMLDNFTPPQIVKVLKPLKEAGFLVELSGGINEKNLARYNLSGVDAISSSQLTMGAPQVDLSLLIDSE